MMDVITSMMVCGCEIVKLPKVMHETSIVSTRHKNLTLVDAAIENVKEIHTNQYNNYGRRRTSPIGESTRGS